MEVTWGQVTSISPVLVRIAGDSSDTAVALKQSGLSLATSDKVALIKLGTTGGWCIVCKVAAT